MVVLWNKERPRALETWCRRKVARIAVMHHRAPGCLATACLLLRAHLGSWAKCTERSMANGSRGANTFSKISAQRQAIDLGPNRHIFLSGGQNCTVHRDSFEFHIQLIRTNRSLLKLPVCSTRTRIPDFSGEKVLTSTKASPSFPVSCPIPPGCAGTGPPVRRRPFTEPSSPVRKNKP